MCDIYDQAETNDFFIRICGFSFNTDKKRFLVYNKFRKLIDLSSETSSNSKYVTTSKGTIYTLTPEYFTITQNGKLIVKQEILEIKKP